MQNIYNTSNQNQCSPQVVDLNEYRRKLAMERSDLSAPEPQPYQGVVRCIPPAPPRRIAPQPAVSLSHMSSWVLDVCASVCVCVMTLAFTLQVLNF